MQEDELRDKIEEIFDQLNDGELIDMPLSPGEAIRRIERIISRESNKAVIEELERQNKHYLSKGGHLLLYDDENGNPVYLSERLEALKEQIGEE